MKKQVGWWVSRRADTYQYFAPWQYVLAEFETRVPCFVETEEKLDAPNVAGYGISVGGVVGSACSSAGTCVDSNAPITDRDIFKAAVRVAAGRAMYGKTAADIHDAADDYVYAARAIAAAVKEGK